MATLKSIKNKYLSASDGEALGVTTNTENVSLLSLKLATADSLSKFNLVDGISDGYTDKTGVDASSTNATNQGGYMYGAVANYMGDSSDGALSTTANVTLTVPTTNGSYDGDMVVKQYSTLTINAGHTLTVNQPCRGLFIYVAGDCTIDGTLSMTGKGGNANPTTSGGSDSNAVGANGLQLGLMTTGGSETFTNDGTGFNGAGNAVRTATANTANISSSGTIFSIARVGGAATVGAGPTPPNPSQTNGTNGATGANTIGTGGGGTGTIQDANPHPAARSGGGGAGGAFSGGAGGGGNYGANAQAGDGGDYGGEGGAGVANTVPPSAGGAGNPGSDTVSGDGRQGAMAEDGAGGIIWLVVGGNINIGANGQIQAHGKIGGLAYVPGGASGGGAAMVLHTGSYTVNNTNSTPISMAGGTMPTNEWYAPNTGGNGGTGGHQVAQLGRTIENLTLISTATTAQAVPTKADVVMTYTNGAGTATINTDLIASVSRDGGTTYTDVTLASQGTTGGHTILSASNVDISGQPSGSSMRYKVRTLNQSAGVKETRVQGVSLGWA